jgi:hypothetical protein
MIKLPMPMIQNTCKLGGDESQCRYLSESTSNQGTFHCLKIVPHLAKVIDGEVDVYKRRLLDTNKKNSHMPFGDNCVGFGIDILEPT